MNYDVYIQYILITTHFTVFAPCSSKQGPAARVWAGAQARAVRRAHAGLGAGLLYTE